MIRSGLLAQRGMHGSYHQNKKRDRPNRPNPPDQAGLSQRPAIKAYFFAVYMKGASQLQASVAGDENSARFVFRRADGGLREFIVEKRKTGNWAEYFEEVGPAWPPLR